MSAAFGERTQNAAKLEIHVRRRLLELDIAIPQIRISLVSTKKVQRVSTGPSRALWTNDAYCSGVFLLAVVASDFVERSVSAAEVVRVQVFEWQRKF